MIDYYQSNYKADSFKRDHFVDRMNHVLSIVNHTRVHRMTTKFTVLTYPTEFCKLVPVHLIIPGHKDE